MLVCPWAFFASVSAEVSSSFLDEGSLRVILGDILPWAVEGEVDTYTGLLWEFGFLAQFLGWLFLFITIVLGTFPLPHQLLLSHHDSKTYYFYCCQCLFGHSDVCALGSSSWFLFECSGLTPGRRMLCRPWRHLHPAQLHPASLDLCAGTAAQSLLTSGPGLCPDHPTGSWRMPAVRQEPRLVTEGGCDTKVL